MSDQKTVAPEELQELKQVRDTIDNHIISLGQIQYQRVLLGFQEEQLKANLLITKEKEKELSDRLVEKYGNVTVDIESGIIS